MDAEESTGEKTPGQKSKHSKAAALAELALVIALSGWIFVEYLHSVSLQSYVMNTIDSNFSILQFAVPIGVGLVLASVFYQRRSEAREAQAAARREEALRKINFAVAQRPVEKIPHQVFVIPRPARDPNFRIRKKTKGKLSRNRGGQRLPHPTEQS